MPVHFAFDHPVGSFMGRAKYGDGFSFTQNCTVGNVNEIYPVIGSQVRMQEGSRILGNSHVGDGCVISAGAMVRNEDVPAHSLVMGKSPHLIIKPLVEA